MAKKRKDTTKEEPVLVTLKQHGDGDATTNNNDDDDDDKKNDPQQPPQQAVGKGATPAANEVASTQLDSDDEDFVKRTKGINKSNAHNNPRHSAALRRERKRLYELQESKRRNRQEEGRSKSNNGDGETPLLQKVKRLKTERKAVYDEYATYSNHPSGGSMKKSNHKKQKKKRSQGIPLPKP